MKILTTNINKGGTGKTTFSYNFAEYLAKKYSVLLLDFDDSGNLTKRYLNEPIPYENTVIALFEGQAVRPVIVKDNLSLIAGSKKVEQLKDQLISKRQREKIFGKWLAQNYQSLSEKYDYVIIDTENDEGLLTTNALIVSDVVIGITDPSMDSVIALNALRTFVSELNEDFDNQADLFFIANRLNTTETSTNDLIQALEKYPNYLGGIKRRTVMTEFDTIFEQAANSKKFATQHQAFIEELSDLFEVIKSKLDGGEING